MCNHNLNCANCTVRSRERDITVRALQAKLLKRFPNVETRRQAGGRETLEVITCKSWIFNSSLSTLIVTQLSVENAMANKAAATKLKMVAKARVTALQKPMLQSVLFHCVSVSL